MDLVCFPLRLRASDATASRPDDKVLDESLAPILDAFKASYGGDQGDDVPTAGAKRSAGSSVRESYDKSKSVPSLVQVRARLCSCSQCTPASSSHLRQSGKEYRAVPPLSIGSYR